MSLRSSSLASLPTSTPRPVAQAERYAFGNLVRTTDAKGNQINIGYDKLGRKTTLSDPSLGNWTYVVDALGQTMRQTDAKQQVTDFEFDALGRQIDR